jgi:hypothetical protein
MAWRRQTGNTHTCGGPKFGRLAPYGSCARCDELHRGAAPRDGYGSRAKRLEAQRVQAIRSHDCRRSGCGPVCTAFDW